MPVEYSMSGTWKNLGYEKEQLMYQSSTMLRAGACEYELKYTVEEKHREAYFTQRDMFLGALLPSKDKPQRAFQKMPGDSCVLRGTYLEFGTRGSGTFGWINQGVDIKTGDPVAIKELRVSSPRSRLEAMSEMNVGKQFLVR